VVLFYIYYEVDLSIRRISRNIVSTHIIYYFVSSMLASR